MSIYKIDKKKFGGKFVATATFKSKKIIAFGDNMTNVYENAIEKGYENPVVNFVHKEGSVCLY